MLYTSCYNYLFTHPHTHTATCSSAPEPVHTYSHPATTLGQIFFFAKCFLTSNQRSSNLWMSGFVNWQDFCLFSPCCLQVRVPHDDHDLYDRHVLPAGHAHRTGMEHVNRSHSTQPKRLRPVQAFSSSVMWKVASTGLFTGATWSTAAVPWNGCLWEGCRCRCFQVQALPFGYLAICAHNNIIIFPTMNLWKHEVVASAKH